MEILLQDLNFRRKTKNLNHIFTIDKQGRNSRLKYNNELEDKELSDVQSENEISHRIDIKKVQK